MRPQNEDGNPHWDSDRFNKIAIFDIQNVLLLRTVIELSQRMGAWNISYCAFLAAKPKEMLIKLT